MMSAVKCGAWLGQLLDLRVVNTVKLCSSETSQAPVLAEIKNLYHFMEKVQVGAPKEVEDRLLVALLHRSRFQGWREVLVSMARLDLFNHHPDLKDAVLLFEDANASLQDLEKAVNRAQSMDASKPLLRAASGRRRR